MDKLAVLVIVLGVLIMELISFYGRYVLKRTGAGGVRIILNFGNHKIGLHHGIFGVLLILGYYLFPLPTKLIFWLLLVPGIILVISDLLHHSLLKIIHGDWDPAEPNPPRSLEWDWLVRVLSRENWKDIKIFK